jgi:aspartate/methionine/tyrosine aminotransferase
MQPFYVMELLEKAQGLEREGKDIVHLEIGEPDFPTPKLIRNAAIRAIDEGKTFYTHSLGLPELRERIAKHYSKTRGVSVSAERVVVTNGTSGAFFLLGAVLLDRARNLVIPDPGYPCYKNFGTLLDASVVPVPVSEKSHFEVLPEQLKTLGIADFLLLICSPSNPTGAVYSETSLLQLHGAVSRQKGIMVVDEIYSGLTYGPCTPSALSFGDDIIVVDGFSKTFAMTGWRLGWMVVPSWLLRPLQTVAQSVFISPPTVSQYAGICAFDAVDEVASMKEEYQRRRDFLLPRLKQIGFEIPVSPEGAFYIYAGIEKWGIDSMEFAERALAEAQVAITPGYDFGIYRAANHIRIAYANSIERLEEGCNRLSVWLTGLSQ